MAVYESFSRPRMAQFLIMLVRAEFFAWTVLPYDLERIARPQSRPNTVRRNRNSWGIPRGNGDDVAHPREFLDAICVPGLRFCAEARRLGDYRILHASEAHIHTVFGAASYKVQAVDSA